jgi:hypothetical protein
MVANIDLVFALKSPALMRQSARSDAQTRREGAQAFTAGPVPRAPGTVRPLTNRYLVTTAANRKRGLRTVVIDPCSILTKHARMPTNHDRGVAQGREQPPEANADQSTGITSSEPCRCRLLTDEDLLPHKQDLRFARGPPSGQSGERHPAASRWRSTVPRVAQRCVSRYDRRNFRW